MYIFWIIKEITGVRLTTWILYLVFIFPHFIHFQYSVDYSTILSVLSLPNIDSRPLCLILRKCSSISKFIVVRQLQNSLWWSFRIIVKLRKRKCTNFNLIVRRKYVSLMYKIFWIIYKLTFSLLSSLFYRTNFKLLSVDRVIIMIFHEWYTGLYSTCRIVLFYQTLLGGKWVGLFEKHTVQIGLLTIQSFARWTWSSIYGIIMDPFRYQFHSL